MKTSSCFGLCLALAAAALSLSPAFAADPGTLVHKFSFPTYAATKDRPQIIDLTIEVQGKPVSKQVMVLDIPAFVEPRRNAGETIQAWHDRVVAARAAASREKAAKIAEAINKKFEAEFKIIGKTVVADVWEYADRQYNNRKGFYGLIRIPSVQEDAVKNTKLYNWVNNPTAEPRGDSLRFERGGSSMGAMGRMSSGLPTFATGYDAFGDQSMVSLGISDLYVADYVPAPGTSDAQVLQALGDSLTRHGIPTSYDASLVALTLGLPLLPGQELVWGNSDPSLELSVFLLAVPEPVRFALMLAGLLLVLLVVHRERAAGRSKRDSA